MIKNWPILSSLQSLSCGIFSVRTDKTRSPKNGKIYDFYVIETNPWVNVIPITEDNKVVMVKQFRHGIKGITLEIPGGLVDPGYTPKEAGKKELLEETGYESESFELIGRIFPQPAIQNNECFIYLAQNVIKTHPLNLEETEDIETVLVPIENISKMIKKGEIKHGIVITAFFFYYLKKGLL